MIVDLGPEEASRTSYITRNQAIYLETESERFEICGTDGTYTVSIVKDPEDKDNEFMLKESIPLKPEHKEVLAEGLSWGELKWYDSSVQFMTKKINTHFASAKQIEPIRNYKVYDKRF